ncbi:DUF4062 domain-containing protein [Paenibacillus chitinolyticus]|uniref:DUF4062 domain-containing protein n=1 Tax=Paenibacillus chitinolyticus TaxID=79263 RepID=UPI003668CE17
MRKKLQIFISSTFTDLKEERQVAVKSILNTGHIPAGMELFTAGDETQKDIIKRWIEESDVYMLILGGRYGSIDKETGNSYTHWEYNYAEEIGKPRFSLVLSENALQRKIELLGFRDATEQNAPQLYKNFRDWLLSSKYVSTIEDNKDIEINIFKSLREIEQRSELFGWVSSKEVPDTKNILQKNTELLEENIKLKKEIEKLKKNQTFMINEFSFDELITYLSNKHIDSPKHFASEEQKLSLLDVFIASNTEFSLGITNSVKMSNLNKFLYFKVAPELLPFGLLEKIKIAGVMYERIQTSKVGLKFMAKLNLKYYSK